MARCKLHGTIRALILACTPTIIVYVLFLQEKSHVSSTRNGIGSWLTATNQQTDNVSEMIRSLAILNQYMANITTRVVQCNQTESTDKITSSKPTNSTNPAVVKDPNEQMLFSPPLRPHEASINVDINIDRNYIFGPADRTSLQPKEGRIPRIIHFMWKTEIIPSVFVDNLKTFAKHNPDWTYYFWTDASCYRFMKDKYPHLLEIYKTYHSNVSRADAARYAVVHYYGGAYFDLDTKCIKPLDPLLETEECIVTPEPMEHAYLVLNRRSILGNCVFLCKPRHGFFLHALSELDKTKEDEVLMLAAGPVFFTDAFSSYIAKCIHNTCNDSIHLMGSEYFLDHVKSEIHTALIQKCQEHSDSQDLLDTCNVWKTRNSENRNLSSEAYTVHLYFGSYHHGDQLDTLPENSIKNIFPNVKIYQEC